MEQLEEKIYKDKSLLEARVFAMSQDKSVLEDTYLKRVGPAIHVCSCICRTYNP